MLSAFPLVIVAGLEYVKNFLYSKIIGVFARKVLDLGFGLISKLVCLVLGVWNKKV